MAEQPILFDINGTLVYAGDPILVTVNSQLAKATLTRTAFGCVWFKVDGAVVELYRQIQPTPTILQSIDPLFCPKVKEVCLNNMVLIDSKLLNKEKI